MRKLSVVIITYNEEGNIARALNSVDFADEIVIVDSFSTDRTVKICRERTSEIHLREFCGHVDQKNFALSMAKNDWVLSIDADEEVTRELKDEIIKLLGSNEKELKDGYRFPRRAFFLGKWIRHSGWYPDYKLRLVLKKRAKWVGIDPSDMLEVEGSCGTLKGDLLHFPYKDFHHNIDTINRYTTIAAGRLFDMGKKVRVTDFTVRPILTFFKKYFIKLGFLDGIPGIVIAVSSSFYTFSKYLKLYELNSRAGKNGNIKQR